MFFKNEKEQSPGSLLWFETRSLPALTRSYPRHFTFYVACPTRSIHQYSSHGPLFQLRSRCSIVCDVLIDGDAGNSFADYIQSQVIQLFEADATFTHVELLAALLVFAGEPG